MATIRRNQQGIEYLFGALRESPKTITRATFWKISHNNPKEDIRLKLGRYTKDDVGRETLETTEPKSELTLDHEEFQRLLEFLTENYEPFRKGVREYIPLNERFNKDSIQHLRAIFNNPDKQKLLRFIATNNILPEDVVRGLELQSRKRAVCEFELMLRRNLPESNWQEWFSDNNWVLGSEFVRVLDERRIDTAHISDYLMQAYDGFLDVIEIKRPEGKLRFWSDAVDHGNYVPASDLMKAITQASRYIYEVELEANSVKFLNRVNGVKTVKPRCVLIFGRSNDWNDQQKEAFRILNASYHNLTIMTYDHVLERARRMLGGKIRQQ